MSLNWYLGPNADEIMRKYPPVEHEDGTQSQNPVTYTIIMSTMSTGIGKLTQAKASDFYARLSVLNKLRGPFVRDADGKPRPITPEDILAHVGLTTNVFPEETQARWTRRILDDQLSSFRGQFALALLDEKLTTLKTADSPAEGS